MPGICSTWIGSSPAFFPQDPDNKPLIAALRLRQKDRLANFHRCDKLKLAYDSRFRSGLSSVMNPLRRILDYDLARVLLVADDPASRLTLKAILEAGGYWVDTAASAAEAVGKLEEGEYELVLTDLQMESPRAGLQVLAQAKIMSYKPATALITTYQNRVPAEEDSRNSMLINPVDVPELLGKVATLISERAARRMERELRLAGV